MAQDNFSTCLAFVWAPGRDSPGDLAHTTAGDPGGLTNGGVIQSTWDDCCRVGIVAGDLRTASLVQLGDVLKATCWEPVCPLVPHGLDLLIFNGVMMTGSFRRLVQQCVGLMGSDVDGQIGPKTVARINAAHTVTLIDAISGAHYAYLHGLLGLWPRFGVGWTKRLKDAQAEAIAMATAVPPSSIRLSP